MRHRCSGSPSGAYLSVPPRPSCARMGDPSRAGLLTSFCSRILTARTTGRTFSASLSLKHRRRMLAFHSWRFTSVWSRAHASVFGLMVLAPRCSSSCPTAPSRPYATRSLFSRAPEMTSSRPRQRRSRSMILFSPPSRSSRLRSPGPVMQPPPPQAGIRH